MNPKEEEEKEIKIPQLCGIFVCSEQFLEEEDEDNLFDKINQSTKGAKYVLAVQDSPHENLICKVYDPIRLREEKETTNIRDQCWYRQLNLLREVILLKDLHHPTIVNFRGFNLFNENIKYSKDQENESDKKFIAYRNPTLFLEYLTNKSLQNFIDNGYTLDPVKRQICMIGITAAVNFLHKNRILHRNLNPKVIWLDDKFYPKIFDFSTSREVNTLETDSGLTIPEIDIISYQSTEILNDKPFGSSTDIFSLARLLYYFITGYEPFKMKEDPLRKASVFQLGPSIKKNCLPLFPENINPELKDLLIRCWLNPDSRPTANEVYYNLIWNENCRIVDSFEGEIKDYIDMIERFENELPDNKLKIIPTFDSYVNIPETTSNIPENESEQINLLYNVISSNFAESNEKNILNLLLAMADNGSILKDEYLQKVISYVNNLYANGNENASKFLVKIFGDFIVNPSEVTEIVSGTIKNTEIDKINVPFGVVKIGKKAFASFKNLERVNLPNSVVSIDDEAFCDCSNLVVVNIPESVSDNNLGKSVFENCTKLKYIKLPSNITIINKKTFKGDKCLTDVCLNQNLQIIGKEAFYGCDSLSYIEIPKNVKVFEEKAFSKCNKLDIIYFHGKKPKFQNKALKWHVKQLP